MRRTILSATWKILCCLPACLMPQRCCPQPERDRRTPRAAPRTQTVSHLHITEKERELLASWTGCNSNQAHCWLAVFTVKKGKEREGRWEARGSLLHGYVCQVDVAWSHPPGALFALPQVAASFFAQSVCSVCLSICLSICLAVCLSFIWLVLWQVTSKSLKFTLCVVTFCAMVLNKYNHKLAGTASATDRQTGSRQTDEAAGTVEHVLNMI